MPSIDSLRKLIGTPRDGALLRYSLGVEYARAGDLARAVIELREALARDPGYSAAWKVLGKTLEQSFAALRSALERVLAAPAAAAD